jgi:4-hydroxy-tetrahydrodipicolinate reductase
MIKMILCGSNGKMGKTVTEIVNADPEIEIVAGVDKAGNAPGGYPVYSNLKDVTEKADVVVDFSRPDALYESNILGLAKERGYALVLCTTGYGEEELKAINEASKDVAILRSANMSLGINLLLKLVAEAASLLCKEGFDPEIIEKHHNQKVDAPSGTALALADSINSVLNNEYEYKYDRHSVREKRPVKEIGISALRGGNIVGEHEVYFAGTDEVIELRHTAYSKAVFGKGAVAAAKFLAGKKPGMYNMQDVV